jgi:hypothetical protein
MQLKMLKQVRNDTMPTRLNEALRRVAESLHFLKLVDVEGGNIIKDPEAKVTITESGLRTLERLENSSEHAPRKLMYSQL